MTDAELVALFITWCAAGGMSPRTTTPWRQLLTRVAREVGPLLEITPEQLAGWLASPGWKQWSRYTYFTGVSAFYDWCELTEHRVPSPVRRIRRPKAPRCLPRPAPLELYRAIVATGDEPYVTAVMLAGLAGLRAGDICGLRREDVTEHTITIRGAKGNKDARLPTHAELWAHIRERGPGLLVPAASGEAMTSPNLARRFADWLERRDLPHVTMHQFRHLFGTMVYRSTRDLLVTQRLMRHASVATTQGYALLEDEAAVHAIGGLTL